MLHKILGIILIVFGGYFTFHVLFQLIGSLFGMLFLLITLGIPLVAVYFGYRLITRE